MKRYTRIILGLAAPITFAVIAVSLPQERTTFTRESHTRSG
jgi:hypothetical protein